MSCVKTKPLLAALMLLSLGFISVSLLIQGPFARTAQSIPPLQKATSLGDASSAKIGFPAPPAAYFAPEMFGDLTRSSKDFSTAKEIARVLPRSVVVVRHFPITVSAPKVSRYISKSVLNI